MPRSIHRKWTRLSFLSQSVPGAQSYGMVLWDEIAAEGGSPLGKGLRPYSAIARRLLIDAVLLGADGVIRWPTDPQL
jgi:hypothetical protein